MKNEKNSRPPFITHLICLLLFTLTSHSLLSERLMKFGRCILKNGFGKISKVLVYRENELTGEIENNESSAFPVTVLNSLYKKREGYDALRVMIGNITEIRLKTGMRVKPLLWANNQLQNYYFFLPIKYGFPKSISGMNDYLNPDYSVNYESLAGRKMKLFLSAYGEKLTLRCTVIVPSLAKYNGYAFPSHVYKRAIDIDTYFEKDDFLQNKEKIKRKDLSNSMEKIMQITKEAKLKIGNKKGTDKTDKSGKKDKKKKYKRKGQHKKKVKDYAKSKIKKPESVNAKDKLTDLLIQKQTQPDAEPDEIELQPKVIDIRDIEDKKDLKKKADGKSSDSSGSNEDSEPQEEMDEEISFASNIDWEKTFETGTKREYSLEMSKKKYEAGAHHHHQPKTYMNRVLKVSGKADQDLDTKVDLQDKNIKVDLKKEKLGGYEAVVEANQKESGELENVGGETDNSKLEGDKRIVLV